MERKGGGEYGRRVGEMKGEHAGGDDKKNEKVLRGIGKSSRVFVCICMLKGV